MVILSNELKFSKKYILTEGTDSKPTGKSVLLTYKYLQKQLIKLILYCTTYVYISTKTLITWAIKIITNKIGLDE